MITRFAPAPTGYLHLGHVLNAIFVWGVARGRGGCVVLRIEDHDRQRCRPEYERAVLDDLEWLGFRPDLGAIDEFRSGPSPFRQSDASREYEEALERLRRVHPVYACDCSRSDLADGSGDESPAGSERPYRGRCRHRGLEPGPGRGLRVVIDAGEETFTDLRLGPQTQDPSRQCGDLLIRDRRGNWTYQFAVVVDDMRHQVDHVIRGRDLLESTGRQLRLARMLGRVAPPNFLHHPLILKAGGQKLSKASGDSGVRDLRGSGLASERVLGRAAHLAGLCPTERALHHEELAELVLSHPA